MHKYLIRFCVPIFAVAITAAAWASPDDQHPSPQGRGRGQIPARGVYKSRITPHWFDDYRRFWYRNDLRGGAKEFIVVDAEAGKRDQAFDHDKLAASLSKASGTEVKGDHLPFSDIEFVQDGKAVQFEASGKTWRCDLSSYECTVAPVGDSRPAPSLLPLAQDEGAAADSADSDDASPQVDADTAAETDHLSPQAQADQNNGAQGGQGRGRRGGGRNGTRSLPSPDGKWTMLIRNYNVYVRAANDTNEIQLSTDGVEGNAYGRPEWSPDSKTLIAWRIEPGDQKEVYLIQSSPPGGGRAVLRSRPYAQAGDKFPHYEVNVFDVASRKQIKPDVDRYEHEYETPQVHWMADNQHFAYQQEDRGHQRLRLIEVDAQTGATRNLIDERSKTFIWTAHTEDLGITYINWLQKSPEIIYVSEMDGWRHFYLIDVKSGKMSQITKGEWVVRGIDRIDEDARQIWFRAGGMNPDQDPYFIHYYRINFDGTGLVALTEGNGTHTIQYSPDRKYIIDTYSRIDTPPIHELRRVSDGKFMCKLEETDITELKESGWEPPEVFVAKGRDGKTDIWGIIARPPHLDPTRKYPVLEDIYSGPQGAYVPKPFTGRRQFANYTDLGFITVQMDAMGTAFRSKAFHDVCWHNLKDAGFPDRILWHKAAAAKYPYYDITRVGIFGTSAGGQNAAAAVIFHSDFYKVAVANSGCHDNRLDKASWNEQWMGYSTNVWSHDPDNWYSQCSNIDNAWRLGGKLFLIVGEMDSNVPPESTMRLVDALIKARKDFDLLVVPGADHGAASPITQRKTQDFFLHNLMGIEPPNRNVVPAGDTGPAAN